MARYWFVIDGSVAAKNKDLPDILFTRVTWASSYEEAVDMFKRDLFGLDIWCINADILTQYTAKSYDVKNLAKEQYYVTVNGRAKVTLSIPLNCQ